MLLEYRRDFFDTMYQGLLSRQNALPFTGIFLMRIGWCAQHPAIKMTSVPVDAG